MTDREVLNLIILAATVGSGWVIIGFSDYAFKKGLAVGRLFLNAYSLHLVNAYAAVLIGLCVAYSVGQWWFVGCVAFSSFVFVELLYAFAPVHSLVIALPVSVVGLVFSAFYV